MSRGPGRWQRLLLHELYHNPRVAPSGRRYINVTDYATTESERSAVYRAKRSLVRMGWATGGAHCQLDPLPALPKTGHVHRECCEFCRALSVQKVTDSVSSEHLRPAMFSATSGTVSVQAPTAPAVTR